MDGINKEDFFLETLTQEDLDDYKRRIGRKSPTAMDAVRFGALSMALEKYLKGKDLDAYNKAIRNRDMETVERLERKIIRRKDKPGHVDKRSNTTLPLGTRVRMKADGKIGVTCRNAKWTIVTSPADEQVFTIQISDEDHPRQDVKRNDFNVLCFNVDWSERGTNRCAKCLQAWYCSRECQKAAWKCHKPNCKPFGQAKKEGVVFIPPENMTQLMS